MKTEHDIEAMLRREGRYVTLSAMESDAIKASLLQRARADIGSVPTPYPLWHALTRVSAAAFAIVLVFAGTAVASQRSLPGDTLYALKVNVVEEMVLLSKTHPRDRAAYELELMETRLDELQAVLRREEPLNLEDLAALSEQIAEHMDEATETIETSDDVLLPHEEKLKNLSRLSSVTKAQSRIAAGEGGEWVGFAASIEAQSDEANASLKDAARDFSVEESEDMVQRYLNTQIAEISADLLATSTKEVVKKDAAEDLTNASEALAEGDVAEALISVLEAQQVIETEEYVGE